MTGFDDLDQATKEQSSGGREDEEPDVEPKPTPTATEQASTSTSDGSDLSNTDPAFPFDEAIQAQIYPRRETHEEFTDFLDIEVKRLLREEGIRNEAGRELHEAVLRVAMNHPREVAMEIKESRKDSQ